MRAPIIAALAGAAALAQPAFALDKVTFGTNWLADPEAGGYYQALVDGTYEKYGLDVTILPGGPDVERRHAAHRRQDRVLHGRRHDRRFPRRSEQHSADHRRRRLPEEPAVLHVPSGRRPRQMGGPAQRETRLRQRRRGQYVLGLDARRLRIQGREHQAVQFQLGALHRRHPFDPAGLHHLGALRGREAGPLQAQRVPARRLRLHHLFDRRSSRAARSSRRTRTWCSVSSAPRRSAGTTISTTTTPRRTR